MSLAGKKVAILAEADFEDSELTQPLEAMREAGAEVTVVGPRAGKVYRGKKGKAEVTSSAAAEDVSQRDFDAIIVPGGHAPDKMRLHQAMIDLVKNAYDSGKLVAAVCHGPQLLISAGIVRGKRLTSWPSVKVDLQNAGADWIDAGAVRDGNLITSRRPSDLPAFSRSIIEALESAWP